MEDLVQSDRQHALRHSTAHLMAQAIEELHPGARFSIGPAKEDGFFYDFRTEQLLGEKDLPAIERRMRRIAKRNAAFERRVLDRADAIALFEERGQPYKVDRIEGLPLDAEISVYDQGGWVDLCRGPHVERTRDIQHFKLTKISGAYLHGDADNEQLQRIYGVVFDTAEELERWVFMTEEAKKRDHRRLGTEMALFLFSDLAPGAPFFLPAGETLWHVLSVAMRKLLVDEGYVAVRTPLIIDHALWETSGHLEHYHQNMFHVLDGAALDRGDKPYRGLKPMNCPCHMVIFGDVRRSYRELPMRIHDQGVLHRNELKGALGGLTRVRQFCQDDAHIFCTEDQIRSEVVALIALVQRVYRAFGLGFHAKLSTRPDERLGEDGLWDFAEDALRGALVEADLEYELKEGDGAFYGPKIDFDIEDAIGRTWQCATIQLDYQLPRRFELEYTGRDGAAHVPVVIHRAIFGSFERFLGILIEHFAGDFPVWLAPESVRVASISEKTRGYAQGVVARLKAAGVRASVDVSDSKIGKKVRGWRSSHGPYLAVVGAREEEDDTVSLRSRSGGEESVSVDELVERLALESRVPFVAP